MKSRLVPLFLLLALISLFAPSELAKTRTSKIVLRVIWEGADFSAPVRKTYVSMSVAGERFRKQTSRKGWLVLADVPCNQTVNIGFGRTGFIVSNPGESPMPVSTKDFRQLARYIPCSNKVVGIGALSWREGGFIGTDMDNIDSCRTC